MPVLGGGVAAFYVFDEELTRLQSVATYGLAEYAGATRSFVLGEGLVGQCAQERRSISITNLPHDYLRITSGLGQAAPAQVVALPSVSKGVVLGVLEVASLRPFDMREQGLLDELLPMVAMSLDILRRNLRTQELLGQTQEQARQLERQTEELKRSEEELHKQSDELQRTNFLADSALDLTRAGYWHVPLDGSGMYNSSARAARIFGDTPNPEYRYTLAHWAEHVRLGNEAAAVATMENFTAAVEGKIPVYDAVYAYSDQSTDASSGSMRPATS
jgi:hypothetical protein